MYCAYITIVYLFQQILEETIVKNLDTGDMFPLSAAETMIPQGKSPVDNYCDLRERERYVNKQSEYDGYCCVT